jgi:site-specific DNA-methyltransferase (adenine-specific)
MNEKTKGVMFSSKSNDWSTPQHFFDQLQEQFGEFTLDPCSNSSNYKVKNHFTERDDGLKQSWAGHNVFMNPPYGRVIKDWLKKAYEESQVSGTTVVALIPARTDTRYWHNYVMKGEAVYFVKGRLKFGNGENSAPFPSAVVVFKKNLHDFPHIGVIHIR